MTAPVAGPLVNAGTATAVINVKGTTLASTAPFVPPHRIKSAPKKLLHLGTNVSGVEAVSNSPKAPYLKNDVNSVQLFRLVSVSRSSYSVPVNVVLSLASDTLCCGQFCVNEPPISSNTGNSITGAVRQDLVPPFRITPLIAEKLQRKICFLPDQRKLDFVISGITISFRIGFDPSVVSLRSANQNMPSASLYPSVIDQNILTELEKGRVASFYSISRIPSFHVIHFGVIPKKYQPGKWRLILDLSSPLDHGVNDGIPKEPFSLQYMKVDNIISGIMSYGQGTLMTKFDAESAYRNVPVHSDDRYLLGMKWRGNYFIALTLPFGLHLHIFSSTEDLLEWILKHNYGVKFLSRYLDDFHTLGPPNSPVCQNNLDLCIRLLGDWGIPLHPDKLEGPSTYLTVLGIELDSIALQACLPPPPRKA